MGREDGGARPPGDEHERMQREAEHRSGETPGGLTSDDLGRLGHAEWQRDRRAAEEREESRAQARRREQQRLDDEQPGESIIDSVEAPDARGRIAEAFGGERRPLVQTGAPAQNRAFLRRMASLGMALLGIFLLWQALQSQGGQVGTPGGATAVPATTAAGTPLTQASPAVNGTATANANFTKVSGPCNLAARFTDRYSFMATNGALTLTQLSNNHVSRGTISPNGEFTTTAEGQGYRGTVSGTMARGQHTYTAQGCNEVYDFTMTFPAAFIGGGGAQQANRPPEAGAIRATQTGTTTSYTVLNVSDPDGDPLRYQWTSTNPCGPPTGHSTPTFVWPHPHPPCPEEGFHPANITVQIDDGRFAITRTYTGGSAPGTGTVPTGGAVTTIAPSPTAIPTTTSRQTTAAPTAGTATTTTGVPNLPFILIALILLIGALGLWFGGPMLAGGPVQEQKKNCDREKAEEERTRREMEAKRAEFDSLNQTRRGAEFAESEAAKAEAGARASVRGTASSVDPVTNETIWGNDARSQAAKRAHEAARDARDDAARRRSDYNARGGDAAWQEKKDASDAATRAHDAAAAALAACLESIAPPPPPPPPASEPVPGGGGATTAGGGATTGGAGTGGPVVAGGMPGGTMTRPNLCPDPPWRIVSQTESTPPIHVADMETTKISLDADRKSYIDLQATLEWARRLRLGGRAANQATRLAPDVRSAMGPMGPLLNFTGKMTDAALDGLEQLGDRLESHFAGGEYSVTYTRRTYVLRCVVKETCSQGVWTRQPPEFSVEETAADENAKVGGYTTDARNQVIGGHGSDIRGQVDRIMRRLFNDLARMNREAERRAKEFEEQCRGGQ